MSAPKSLYLSDKQLEGLSIITSDAGQVLLASTIVPFFTGVATFNLIMLPLGSALTIICYVMSVYLRKNL